MKNLHNLMILPLINMSSWHLLRASSELGNGYTKIHQLPFTQGVHNYVEIKTLKIFCVPNLRSRIVMGFIPTVNTETEWDS